MGRWIEDTIKYVEELKQETQEKRFKKSNKGQKKLIIELKTAKNKLWKHIYC